MTAYTILREQLVPGEDEHSNSITGYTVEARLDATNAEQACRRAAEKLSDEDLNGGVTLIAVPARNWTSGRNTFAAKTERKLIRS